MAINDLATILDNAGEKVLVEKFIRKRVLENVREYKTVLANTKVGLVFDIPDGEGTYLEARRMGRMRLPEEVDMSNPTADPASGALLSYDLRVKFPIGAIHEYAEIGKFAQIVSRDDLKNWLDNEIPISLKRAMHRRVQAAYIVGRYTPGVWGAAGTATTAFETTVATTLSLWGITFTFPACPRYYPGMKPAFAAIQPGDRARFKDLCIIRDRLSLAGARRIDGAYNVYLSDSMATDLCKDDRYFEAMVNAFKGEGLKEGVIAERYQGMRFIRDDEYFAENWGAQSVRSDTGPLHTLIITGMGAFAYVDLGNRRTGTPTTKIQDITKTGKSKTIGYTVPFQAAIVDASFGACYTAPVNAYTANNA